MVRVEHAGNTIETVSIEPVLFHPEAEVTQQETQDLVVTVVEQTAVPQLVTALGTLMEVEVISAIKLVDPIDNILGRMAVNNVKKNHQTHAVGGINKLLQILGVSIATAGREEIVDLVAETGIVGMLHDGHQLDGIVS